MAFASSALVLVLIGVLVVVKVTGGAPSNPEVSTPVSAAALSELSGIPLSRLVTAAESTQTGMEAGLTSLPSSVPALVSGGKPEILYIGAEYCPYCAAERWALVTALSKFGTFSNLTTTKSSSTDTNPNTPTFSFVGSTYTSPYISFAPVELENRAGKTLQTPTSAQASVLQTYDAAPYVSGSAGAIPFIDLGGKYVISGGQYDGSSLSGMSFDSALASLTSGSNATSQAAEASAGRLVGAICSMTHGQPSSVCSAVPASLQSGQGG